MSGHQYAGSLLTRIATAVQVKRSADADSRHNEMHGGTAQELLSRLDEALPRLEAAARRLEQAAERVG